MPEHQLSKEQEQPIVQKRTSNNDGKTVQRAEREAVSPFGGKSFWHKSNAVIQGKGGIGYPAVPIFGKKQPIQQKADTNNTGLPDNLKSGIENLSGYSMDDVKVHYNSDKPAQLQAHAYAQGTDIHLGAGQEKHLPHEAWHVVQQKQGRVKPTVQMKGKVNVNDDKGLEKEADVMGAKALQNPKPVQKKEKSNGRNLSIVQKKQFWGRLKGAESAPLRRTAEIPTDKYANILHDIRKGTEFEVIARKGAWKKAIYRDTVGYVDGQYVEMIPALTKKISVDKSIERTASGKVIAFEVGKKGGSYVGSSSDIEKVQTLLYRAGYLPKDQIDGYIGKITVGAIIAFQKANGLTETGYISPADNSLGVLEAKGKGKNDAIKAQNDAAKKKQIDDKNSLEKAKKIILKSVRGLGTSDNAIYNAIKACENRKDLLKDAAVMSALKGDFQGHGLWKCYLLIEYGDESNYPTAIKDLQDATEGLGTYKGDVYTALNNMDKRAKSSFGLEYILRWELSGDALEKALDLIAVSDSIDGSFLSSGKDGEEKLNFTDEKLRELIDSRFIGSGSPDLISAMNILYPHEEGAEISDAELQALKSIESIRGLKEGDGLKYFKIAMEKKFIGMENYEKHIGSEYNEAEDNPSPPLSKDNESFTASSAQLRFGKVVGDAFGIDAVFGSLISPTGGIAGEGNDRVAIPYTWIEVKDGGAVATHGAVHDAAGYLYNCHGIGPGYDYRQSESGSEPGNPLAGQTNMQWWIDEFDETGNDVSWFDGKLNSTAHVGAAVSKDYTKLNITEKKEVLETLITTWTLVLNQIEIDNEGRAEKIQDLMDSCSDKEKTEFADDFYNKDGHGSSGAVYRVMKPYVSEEVYDKYLFRLEMKNLSQGMGGF